MANPRPTRQWPKGTSGNPQGYSKGRRGRPPGEKPHRVVLWDLQQAAKDRSARGLEILEQCMEDTTADWNTRLKAIEMLWERGYGKPQVSVALNATHSFAEVPQTMELDEWLANKGQATPNGWLEHQQAKDRRRFDAEAKPAETIDLKAEPSPPAEEQPGPESDQPLPPVDPSKLN
jgi:hypothetical protein